MGVGCLDECRNLKEFKSKSRTWVKENISVKPVRSEKSMRFGQRTTRNSQVREALIEEENQGRQRQITDFSTGNETS